MASELKVDKFTGVTTAGSILVTGEGNSTTTNLQQGLAKCWCSWNDSTAIQDSFNTSSLDDDSTGVTKVNYSSNFGNDDYVIGAICRQSSSGGDAFMRLSNTRETGRQRFTCVNSDTGNDFDGETQTVLFAGDLA